MIILIRVDTWNHIIVFKLLVLDINICNYIAASKLLVLDRNTWNHINVCKQIIIIKSQLTVAIIVYKWLSSLVTWNHITAFKNEKKNDSDIKLPNKG